ncbi:MAG: ATP-binding protein [Marinilabiliaceae bacterium]|nr:ATP-binding protein [Marinilabiliaceae bacterium]
MKKPILTGEESFEKIIEGNYFYIDKTLFIKELLENKGTVTLITRPRRFGKTLNMNMLQHFFDVNKDSKPLFEGLKIMEHNDIVEKHLNKYPVVSLTLKNVEFSTYEKSIEKIKSIVSSIYRQNRYLCESDRLDEQQKKDFYRYFSKEASEAELQDALLFLTECLYTYHKKRVIVLLDEYDSPIDSAYIKGYYANMVSFMRGFMGNVFKTNNYLEFGVLTGVQRISKESLISEFNNPLVCGIMDKLFATCFGFTEDEVKEACFMYGLSDNFEEVEKSYNGYRFGGQDIYNPWSIVGFLKVNELKDFWANTGSMNILSDIFFKGSPALKNDIAGLLTDKPIMMKYVEHIKYPISYKNDNIFWSMLLNAGYIKPCAGATGNRFFAELVNSEVKNALADSIEYWFDIQENQTPKVIKQFVTCLLNGDKEGVSETLNKELLNNPSCHDFKEENSYHMFIFGILLALSNDYIVYSNPESGKGRSDCLIKPNDKEKFAVVAEFKHCSDEPVCSSTEPECSSIENASSSTKPARSTAKIKEILKKEAQIGLKQIEDKVYIHNLKKEGYKKIYKYGIAFHKKTCVVEMEITE